MWCIKQMQIQGSRSTSGILIWFWVRFWNGVCARSVWDFCSSGTRIKISTRWGHKLQGSRIMDGSSWWQSELFWCVFGWFYPWKSHNVFEVRKRWVVRDRGWDETAVDHVAFILLVEVLMTRCAKQVLPVGFVFGRRVGLLCVFSEEISLVFDVSSGCQIRWDQRCLGYF